MAIAGETEDRRLFLPFKVEHVIETFQLEEYMAASRNSLQPHIRRLFYRLKPALPRPLQIQLRRWLVPWQRRQAFPAWPLDCSLDEFYRGLLGLLMQVSRMEKVPFIWYWPEAQPYAVVLTHDVETQIGHDTLLPMIELERKYGVRSLWNFVPERYQVDRGLLAELAADGFEIGVHGLRHDGRLFDSLDVFKRRALCINQYREEWGSVGFRAPSVIRNLKWIAEFIHPLYDTSCPTTEVYAAQPGGCCSVFPFQVGGMVELPITLPQDHTLFAILQEQSEQTWYDVANKIMTQHGLINIIVHPDYTTDSIALRRYENFLNWLRSVNSGWFALPKDVAAWWRNRAAQTLEFDAGAWQIRGPDAARARIGEAYSQYGSFRVRIER